MDLPRSGPVLNINVGILGHVDSGKTTLARALSDIAGTAAFDKNPQSQERGITIDLGFSALVVDIPPHLRDKENHPNFEKLQFTFVDCPGHASLIRTIIGGAQIIDMMVLVVDISKGIQTQTAECLVIGDILCKHMVVVLNKIDLIAPEKRDSLILKMKKKMTLTLADMSFQNIQITALSANVSVRNDAGLTELVDTLKSISFIPKRNTSKPFVFAVDHCFTIRGHGSVMTGTVIQGGVSIKDVIEIPSLGIKAKVKSMQMFRKLVQRACEGDRVGICIGQIESKQLERGLVCSPGYLTPIWAAIIAVNRVKYFRGSIKSKNKFHISISHETVVGSVTVFKAPFPVECLSSFNFSEEYEYQEELIDDSTTRNLLLIKFEKPVLAMPDGLIIGSRLDMDVNGMSCRLAFWGRIKHNIFEKNFEASVGSQLKIYKQKSRRGIVDRVAKDNIIIVKDLIKKETNPEAFIGLSVELSSGERGIIESTFGKSGKLNIHIPDGLKIETLLKCQKLGGKKVPNKDNPVEVLLTFKRYIFDVQKKIVQSH